MTEEERCNSPQSGYVTYSEALFSPTMKDIRDSFDSYSASPLHDLSPRQVLPSGSLSSPNIQTKQSQQDVWHPQAIRLKRLWQKTQQELDSTRRELKQAKDRYYRLGAEHKQLRVKEEEVGSLGNANRSLMEQLEQAEHHIDLLRQEKSKLNHENAHLQTRLDTCSQEISSFERRECVYELRIKKLTQSLQVSTSS